MKVLQINATYGYGSTGLIVRDIGDALEKNGDEAYFAYQSCLTPPDNGYRVGSGMDRKWHALLCRLTGMQGYFSKRATKRLIRHIAEVRPDVVHLHNLHSNYIHLNTLLSYLAKEDIATVVTLHDCWFFTGKCFHYADVGCTRFQTGCGRCPKKKAPPKSLFFDPSMRVLRDRRRFFSAVPRVTLVGCSRWICDEARKGCLSELPLEHVYNGVDTTVFAPKDTAAEREVYGLSEDTYVILGMANKWLLPVNRALLLRMAESLDEKTKLLLVGCSEQDASCLKEISDHIVPVGFIRDREMLARHYALASVFVNVTQVDTLPTVNMESICCGTPVITYDGSGSGELVLEGCGEVVAKNDVQGLLAAIARRPEKLGEEALSRAREIFDKDACYRMYLDVYKKARKERKEKA